MNSPDDRKRKQDSQMTASSHFSRRSLLLGSLGFATLAGREVAAKNGTAAVAGLPGLPHFPPKVKRVIYLFQSGGPAQMDLFDYKPGLKDKFGQDVPRSVYPDERKTTMSSAQAAFPVAPSIFKFSQHGQGGTWISEA
ncbi:MAG: DUF1501 domain-containing protein, partial [Pirellulales bacterium]|nr:DUF1501 domain-containing protein [Pirellulales bacterium]